MERGNFVLKFTRSIVLFLWWSTFPYQSVCLSVKHFALAHCAHCAITASCPSPRPQGASPATCPLRQTGGGAYGVEIPCKEL